MASIQDPTQITVSCTTEYPAYKHDKSKCWGLVTLKAPSYEPEESKRPALDIVAVIDKSGSMSGEKLSLVKKSLKFLVQNLLEKDRLCVITYDTRVSIVFDLLRMDGNNKKFAKNKIKEIHCGSSTNLSGGLLQGLSTILDRGETKNDVASVLLFTDGLANCGITNKAKIIEAMKDPKKYLQKSDYEMSELDVIQRYQCNSTPAVSCGSLSSGASAPQRRSFLSRNLRNFVNLFNTSSTQQVQTGNMPEDEQNAIDIQQNIAPQAVQPLQVQQATQPLQVQQRTQAIQQSDAEIQQSAEAMQLEHPAEQALQQEQSTEEMQHAQDEQALQQSTEVTQQEQPEQALQQEQSTEEMQQAQVEQALQQSTEAMQQEQPEQALQQEQSTEEMQVGQALQQSTEVTQQPVKEGENKENKGKVDIDASVYTFGFGTDHDPEMLKAISDAANGMYYFIENEKQISESFGHCFGGLVSTLGQNINLTLEVCDGVTVDAIHTDQSYTSDETKQKWEVHLGDMQSEEERDVLLTLNLPCSELLTATILKSSIKYFCVIDCTYRQSEAEMSVNRSADAEYSPEVANSAIDRQRNRILTTKVTREALELADKGELELARKRFQEEIKRVKESLTKDDKFCKLLIKDMEKSLEGLQSRHLYETSGKKIQMNLLQTHSNQRSNRIDSSLYSNVSKSSYMAKFK